MLVVSDVKAQDVVAARAVDDVRTCAALLVTRHLSTVPVVDDHRRLVGVVSDADLLHAGTSGTRGRASHRRWQVHEVMVPPVPVRPQDDLELAVSLLSDRRVRCLPVVDDGELVGVVSRQHLMELLGGYDPLARQQVLALLAELWGTAPGAMWDVVVADGVAHLLQQPGAHVARGDRDLAVVLARTVPGVVGVVVDPAVGPTGPSSPGRRTAG